MSLFLSRTTIVTDMRWNGPYRCPNPTWAHWPAIKSGSISSARFDKFSFCLLCPHPLLPVSLWGSLLTVVVVAGCYWLGLFPLFHLMVNGWCDFSSIICHRLLSPHPFATPYLKFKVKIDLSYLDKCFQMTGDECCKLFHSRYFWTDGM